MVDCSADLVSSKGVTGATLQAADTLDLARKLCEPFKLEAKLATADHGPPLLTPITVELGETAYQVIERVARWAAFLVYEDEFGALVLDRVGTKKMASGFVMGTQKGPSGGDVPGNIESAASELSFNERYSRYTVVYHSVSQFSNISPLANNRADVFDETMPEERNRPLIIRSEQWDLSVDIAKARANWELARRIGRSQAISLTCDSWRDAAGQLWQPNYLAVLNAPAMKIVNVEWIIGSVTFRRDESGTHADVTLMPPDAFKPQPAPLYLWDSQVMHDLGSTAPSVESGAAP